MNRFIPVAKPDMDEREIKSVIDTIKSGWLTTGPKVFEFEEKLSEYLTEREKVYTVALNSCTSALFLSLVALGIGRGDEVIVPTWTFAATAHVVEWTGAKVVLCDVEEDSLNLDCEKAEQLITEKTKAIIPVHFAGYPCNMKLLSSLAEKYNLKIIEDAAHAIGTKYNDEKIGNFSNVTCFSFYATKNLAMGEGGAAVSKDSNLIEKIRKLSYFGINKEAFKRYSQKGKWFYDIEELGFKCNSDSIHAAIGVEQITKLDKMINKRRELVKYYKNNLSNKLILPADSDKHYHSYHLFPIRLPEGINRDYFIEQLKQYNVGTSVHFIPLHLHSFYRKRFSYNFEIADKVFQRIVSIPMYSSLTINEVKYVTDTINKLVG